MNYLDKALNLLGIAKNGGLLAIGSDAVAVSVKQGMAQLVISASDTSTRSINRAKSSAEEEGIKHLVVPYSKFELGSITGRGSPGTLSVLDKGLAAAFLDKLKNKSPSKPIDSHTANIAAKEGDAI